MRVLLALTLWYLLVRAVFQIDLTVTTGLSVENGIIYLLTLFLLLRIIVGSGGTFGARPLHVAWVVLIGCAIVSWLIAGVLIRYPGYDLIASGILLKSELIDHYIYFLLFFLGARTANDATSIIRALLLAVTFTNAMTVADVAGVFNLNLQERADGRAQGPLGESNQYGAFIILFLPALFAAALSSHALRRVFWLGTVLISGVALLMTVSRGGLVGLLVACAMGAWLYRHYISVGRLSAWVVGCVVVVMLLLSASQYEHLIAERVLTQTGSIDLSDASSGRTEIWSGAIAKMLSAPVTLFTGFGWNAYSSFPFRYAPHNHYLGLWFNLGLVGLISGAVVLFYAIGLAKRASDRAAPALREALISFVIGAIALCTAIFFVDLHVPWPYFWAYAGLAMRIAVSLSVPQPSAQLATLTDGRATPPATDAHGWVARSRSMETNYR
jgi:hypothetical protein